MKITGCWGYMFKSNEAIRTGGRCRLMDETFNQGLKSSETMRKNNNLLHVGISKCKEGKITEEWCTNCENGKVSTFI